MRMVQQVHAYLLKFRKYDWLWKEDKDVQYKRFVQSNPAISDYEVIMAANTISGGSITLYVAKLFGFNIDRNIHILANKSRLTICGAFPELCTTTLNVTLSSIDMHVAFSIA